MNRYPELSWYRDMFQVDRMERENRFISVSRQYRRNLDEHERLYRQRELRECLANERMIDITIEKYLSNEDITLPPSMSDVASYLAENTKLDFIGIAYAICGAISIATWGRVSIKLSDSWSEPAVDMLLQISGSGTRKSSLAQYLRIPFDEFCKMKNKNYEEKAKQCKEKLRIAKKFADKYERDKIKSALNNISVVASAEEQNNLKKEIDDLAAFNSSLMKDISIPYRVQLLLDKATPFKLASTLSEQGECQGCITAEASMLSNMIKSPEDTDIFLRGHTQEPYTYENAQKKIMLSHPALPMVNLVQHAAAYKLYSNEYLHGCGMTARFVPYFYKKDNYSNECNRRNNFDLYLTKIEKLLHLFHTQDLSAERYQVEVTADALRLIEDFESEIHYKIIPCMPKSAIPCLCKAHGQAVRFAWDIHAWNNADPLLYPINAEEMMQGIDLVYNTFNHIYYAYDSCGFVALCVAQKILDSLYRITDYWEQDKLLNEGIDSTTIQQRIGVKSKEVNNALIMLERHNYIRIYDYGTKNLKIILHPYFYS